MYLCVPKVPVPESFTFNGSNFGVFVVLWMETASLFHHNIDEYPPYKHVELYAEII